MSVPEERYRRRAITRSKNWTIKDAFHALDEEFWCRNVANNPKDFVAGVSHPLEGDPGYQFWLELNGEIRQYFHIAADSPDKKGSHHPMTRKTIDAALTAIDAFYGDRVVVVDGEQVPWEEAIPRRAEWIVDRFCSPFQGWNPILSNAASILGLNQWLDIMGPGPETEIRPSIQEVDGPTQGDTQGDGPSYMGAWRSFKNDDVLEELKKGLEDQSKKVKELNTDVGYLMGDYEIRSDDLKALKKELTCQDQKVERLENSVVELTTKVDKRKDEQEERHKKQLEEVEKRLTTTVDEIKSLKSSILHQSPAGVSTVTTAGGAATESVEDVFSSGTKPSTPKPRGPPSNTARGQSGSASLALSGLYAPIKSSSPLDVGQASRKRKASAQSSPTSTPEPRRLASVTARGQSGSASLALSGLYAPIKSSSPLDVGPASLKHKASAQTGPTPTRTFTVGGRNNSQGSSNRSSPLTNHGFSKTDPRLKELLIRRRRRNKETSEEETSEEEKTKEKKANEKTPKQDGK
ncbi:uncharacterized protein FSUBG_13270 [Fusarium subglutinans]|uniref:Uncharacterized protein n=1 Tax=Gibberella subglutinans TaxID=42677 RepID=A0A8H5KXF7_GIBSU|nr:uncharacterized protein FSUBG_13270 [Fusarium subglutinans]KAF5580939.1 hypothetical protein FSUBG_13270 [Fusarium subglutinans]